MFLIYTRRGALCAPVRWIWIYFMGIVPAPSGLGDEGCSNPSDSCNRVAVGVGVGSRRGRRFYIARSVRLRGLKNKPKIRYFVPNFSLLFH